MLSNEISYPLSSLERLIKARRTSRRNKNSIVNETKTSIIQKYRDKKQKDTWWKEMRRRKKSHRSALTEGKLQDVSELPADSPKRIRSRSHLVIWKLVVEGCWDESRRLIWKSSTWLSRCPLLPSVNSLSVSLFSHTYTPTHNLRGTRGLFAEKLSEGGCKLSVVRQKIK